MRKITYANWQIINGNCIDVLKNDWPKERKVDLVFADPPFGINFGTNNGYYNRDKNNVVGKYREVKQEDYQSFSAAWLEQAYRILKDNGLLWTVSGWTNNHITRTEALHLGFNLVNEVIWKHNFATWNPSKFISTHYVLSLYAKNPNNYYFNPTCRFPIVKGKGKNKENYADRLSVWEIPKEYRRGKEKTPNMLPYALVTKMLQYTTKKDFIILDLFLGSGIVGIAAYDLDCKYIGIELDEKIFRFARKFLSANTWSREDKQAYLDFLEYFVVSNEFEDCISID